MKNDIRSLFVALLLFALSLAIIAYVGWLEGCL